MWLKDIIWKFDFYLKISPPRQLNKFEICFYFLWNHDRQVNFSSSKTGAKGNEQSLKFRQNIQLSLEPPSNIICWMNYCGIFRRETRDKCGPIWFCVIKVEKVQLWTSKKKSSGSYDSFGVVLIFILLVRREAKKGRIFQFFLWRYKYNTCYMEIILLFIKNTSNRSSILVLSSWLKS